MPRFPIAIPLLLIGAAALVLAGCAGTPERRAGKVTRTPPTPSALPPPRALPPPVASAPPPAKIPSPTPSPVIAGPPFIRVLLSSGTREIVLEAETLRAWDQDGRLVATGPGRVDVEAAEGRIRWGGSTLLGETIDVAGTPALIIGNRKVGGRVRLIAKKGALLAVAVVPLDAYVAAVVSREAPPRFLPESLAAMAVAVRTYALGAVGKPRNPAYDVVGSVEDQVFEGMDNVAPAFQEAAERTHGIVVRYRGALAQTVYHSTCGGRTESAESAWGRDVPYLRSQTCTECADSPVYRWEYRMSLAEGQRLAQALGIPPSKVIRFVVAGRTPSGRARRVHVSSGGVSRELQAAAFRKAAGYAKVRSLKMEIEPVPGGWRFTGEGYGHGVGMCQFGANGMARRGATYREILAWYYPGTQVVVAP